MTYFEMRKAPTKPKRSQRFFSTYGPEPGDTIEQIIASLAAHINKTIKSSPEIVGYDYITHAWLLKNLNLIAYDDTETLSVCLTVPESDEDFAIKMAYFNKKNEEFNKWRKTNALKIKEFEAKQERKAKEKEIAAANRARLEKQKKKESLRKLLENTQKKLSKLKAEEADKEGKV
jgi:hypothetical protein